MDFDEFRGRTESIDKLTAAGDDRALAAELESLAAEDLPDLDRVRVLLQLSQAYERIKDSAAALKTLDRAAVIENRLSRFQASFRKADYLSRLGRHDECRDILKALLERPEATLSERHSFASRLKLLRRVAK
ncbi:MAG: hypothetical protein M0D55_04205 [Elusimicrobiota bacterium]|nr:MAG: hypothetical protein M0D55_04205 [Elusimicrobiota bacterium]